MTQVEDDDRLELARAALRHACTARTRELGDLHRNACLWLSCWAGLPASDSSFLVPGGLFVDQNRLTELPYVAALGFVAGLENTLVAPMTLVDGLKAVVRRRPHTRERTGFADDPWTLAGLYVASSLVQNDEVYPVMREEMNRKLRTGGVPAGPTLAVRLALRPPETWSLGTFHVKDAPAEGILAFFAKSAAFSAMFPSQKRDQAVASLTTRLCSEQFRPLASIENMLMLAALEVLARSRRAHSSLPCSEHSHRRSPRIVCLHAPEDHRFAVALEKHVSAIRSKHNVDFWAPHKIPAGVDTSAALERAVAEAHLVVPILSADYMSWPDCQVPGGVPGRNAVWIPVVARSFVIQSTPFERLLKLPRSGPIAEMNEDVGWTEVAEELLTRIENDCTGA